MGQRCRSRQPEAYEDERWPIEAPHPLAAIRYVMAMRGYKQRDLAKVLRSRSRASEVLDRRRHLTLEMAWAVHKKWGIPADSLFDPLRCDRSASAAARRDTENLDVFRGL